MNLQMFIDSNINEEVPEENLDLEAIIRELESELSEQDDAYDDKVGKTDA